MAGFDFLIVTFGLLAAVVAFVLLIIFVMVPLFRGVGAFIAACFHAVAWFFAHIFEFIGGIIGDTLRCVGAILAMLALAPLSLINIIIARWSAAAHFADSVRREFLVAGACLYRVLIRRPLKLFWLHGLLEGIEQRVPEAVHGSPGTDKPSRRTGQFDGYTIVGSLAGGGSGGKLYIARPDELKRNKLVGQPEHVVIKAFALSEGSSLPQIVRESRALECAKQLGHVLDHGMDEHRFHYVMPYHAGDHLGIITRQLHGESDGSLSRAQLAQVMGYIKDLLATLSLYHDGGLWHKDVKPENIIVHDGRAHLVDLGLVTPLKSAMTLTTHGTEYFRDPEMVRQALRGVKVHQVDGAKFDIYAVGAVLYYIIENTFPAHGGLSRFSKKSPEALRWIVRRAMAEYNQRYTSAAMVLADIEAVAAASDPFAFKPADLPSMKGTSEADLDTEIHTESPHAAQVHAAGSSTPREREKVWALGAGAGSSGPFAHAGPVNAGSHATRAGARRRPLLRITNWWTGAYSVDDDGRSKPQPGPKVRPVAMRRTAQEQIAAARARARDMRHRMTTRRHKVGLDRQPSAMLGFLSLGFLVIVGLIVFAIVQRGPESVLSVNVTTNQPVQAKTPDAPLVRPASASGPPLLLVVDGDDEAVQRHSELVSAVAERYSQRGFHIVHDESLVSDELRSFLAQWQREPGVALDARFEDILAEHDLYGFLKLKLTMSSSGQPRISETMIQSGRPDARQRSRLQPAAGEGQAIASGALLLVNDHPVRSDPRAAARIETLVDSYRQRGWDVRVDDDIEVEARKVLPAAVEPGQEPSNRLTRLLKEHGLRGVLYIEAGPGEGEPHERVRFVELIAAESPVNPE